ncbi:MAG: ATP-binding protein [Gemmatimonadaceae bacterium]
MTQHTNRALLALSSDGGFFSGDFHTRRKENPYDIMPGQITPSILAEIVGIAADAIICIDSAQRITFFNTGAETIFGWSAEEMIGQRIEALLPERYRARHAEQVNEFGRSGVTARRMGERREIAGVRKNGDEFPAEAAISQVHQEGKIVYAVVLRDVSVRKRYEERQSFLARAGERLASSFRSEETLGNVAALAVPALAEGCIIENLVGEVFHAGAVAHREESVRDVLVCVQDAPPRRPPDSHPLGRIRKGERAVLLEENATERLLEVSGAKVYIDAVQAMSPRAALFLPLFARGQLIGALSLFRSTTSFDSDDVVFAEGLARLAALAVDNARLHETLITSLRSREEVLGIVSHDLRNPLAAVKMLTRSVLPPSDASSRDNLSSAALILQAAEQMEALIRDMLDVSSLDSGNLRVAPEVLDPSALISESLKTLLPLLAEKQIEIVTHLPSDLPSVSADRERVQQTLSNLIGNAVKFTPPGGRVAVTAVESNEFVTISVADSGSGIAKEHLPRVFERYWQSARTQRHGAGLGLAIAKGIVEAHGGRIWIESDPGIGTTVFFTLPVATVRVRQRSVTT